MTAAPIDLASHRKQRSATSKFALVPILAALLPGLGVKARVYIALASFADRNGECYPSDHTLAEMLLNVDIRSIRRARRGLAQDGLIRIERRSRSDGAATSNFYTIIKLGDPAGSARGDPAGSARGDPAGSARGDPAGSARGDPAGSARGTYVEQTRKEQTTKEDALSGERASRARAERRPPINREPIAKDWRPNQADCDVACSFGYDMAWVHEATETFRDYHLSRGSLLADTSAAWRNFIRRADDFGPWLSGAAALAPSLQMSDGDTAPPDRSDEEWREIVGDYKQRGCRGWPLPRETYGLKPEHIASRVPVAIRQEFGFA